MDVLKLVKDKRESRKSQKPKIPRKTDKKQVRSLWHARGPVAWSPVEYDERAVESLIHAYSYKDLRTMASNLGLEYHLSKKSLAICIVTEKNIFFPAEVGNYTHENLVYMISKFKLLPNLTEDEAFQMTVPELQKILLEAWKGGSDEDMYLNLQHVIDLNDVMEGIEGKFCSDHVKKILRTASKDKPSLYDLVETAMSQVLSLYKEWASSSDQAQKRKLFVAARLANAHAEKAVVEYLRVIRKYCKSKTYYNCDAADIPKMVSAWMKSSDAEDKVIMCNVTVKGRIIQFTEGEYLIPGFKIYIVVHAFSEEGEEVVWLGVGKPGKSDVTEYPEPSPATEEPLPPAEQPFFPEPPPVPNYPQPAQPTPPQPTPNYPNQPAQSISRFLDVYERFRERTEQKQYVRQSIRIPQRQAEPVRTGVAEPGNTTASSSVPHSIFEPFAEPIRTGEPQREREREKTFEKEEPIRTEEREKEKEKTRESIKKARAEEEAYQETEREEREAINRKQREEEREREEIVRRKRGSEERYVKPRVSQKEREREKQPEVETERKGNFSAPSSFKTQLAEIVKDVVLAGTQQLLQTATEALFMAALAPSRLPNPVFTGPEPIKPLTLPTTPFSQEIKAQSPEEIKNDPLYTAITTFPVPPITPVTQPPVPPEQSTEVSSNVFQPTSGSLTNDKKWFNIFANGQIFLMNYPHLRADPKLPGLSDPKNGVSSGATQLSGMIPVKPSNQNELTYGNMTMEIAKPPFFVSPVNPYTALVPGNDVFHVDTPTNPIDSGSFNDITLHGHPIFPVVQIFTQIKKPNEIPSRFIPLSAFLKNIQLWRKYQSDMEKLRSKIPDSFPSKKSSGQSLASVYDEYIESIHTVNNTLDIVCKTTDPDMPTLIDLTQFFQFYYPIVREEEGLENQKIIPKTITLDIVPQIFEEVVELKPFISPTIDSQQIDISNTHLETQRRNDVFVSLPTVPVILDNGEKIEVKDNGAETYQDFLKTQKFVRDFHRAWGQEQKSIIRQRDTVAVRTALINLGPFRNSAMNVIKDDKVSRDMKIKAAITIASIDQNSVTMKKIKDDRDNLENSQVAVVFVEGDYLDAKEIFTDINIHLRRSHMFERLHQLKTETDYPEVAKIVQDGENQTNLLLKFGEKKSSLSEKTSQRSELQLLPSLSGSSQLYQKVQKVLTREHFPNIKPEALNRIEQELQFARSRFNQHAAIISRKFKRKIEQPDGFLSDVVLLNTTFGQIQQDFSNMPNREEFENNLANLANVYESKNTEVAEALEGLGSFAYILKHLSKGMVVYGENAKPIIIPNVAKLLDIVTTQADDRLNEFLRRYRTNFQFMIQWIRSLSQENIKVPDHHETFIPLSVITGDVSSASSQLQLTEPEMNELNANFNSLLRHLITSVPSDSPPSQRSIFLDFNEYLKSIVRFLHASSHTRKYLASQQGVSMQPNHELFEKMGEYVYNALIKRNPVITVPPDKNSHVVEYFKYQQLKDFEKVFRSTLTIIAKAFKPQPKYSTALVTREMFSQEIYTYPKVHIVKDNIIKRDKDLATKFPQVVDVLTTIAQETSNGTCWLKGILMPYNLQDSNLNGFTGVTIVPDPEDIIDTISLSNRFSDTMKQSFTKAMRYNYPTSEAVTETQKRSDQHITKLAGDFQLLPAGKAVPKPVPIIPTESVTQPIPTVTVPTVHFETGTVAAVYENAPVSIYFGNMSEWHPRNNRFISDLISAGDQMSVELENMTPLPDFKTLYQNSVNWWNLLKLVTQIPSDDSKSLIFMAPDLSEMIRQSEQMKNTIRDIKLSDVVQKYVDHLKRFQTSLRQVKNISPPDQHTVIPVLVLYDESRNPQSILSQLFTNIPLTFSLNDLVNLDNKIFAQELSFLKTYQDALNQYKVSNSTVIIPDIFNISRQQPAIPNPVQSYKIWETVSSLQFYAGQFVVSLGNGILSGFQTVGQWIQPAFSAAMFVDTKIMDATSYIWNFQGSVNIENAYNVFSFFFWKKMAWSLRDQRQHVVVKSWDEIMKMVEQGQLRIASAAEKIGASSLKSGEHLLRQNDGLVVVKEDVTNAVSDIWNFLGSKLIEHILNPARTLVTVTIPDFVERTEVFQGVTIPNILTELHQVGRFTIGALLAAGALAGNIAIRRDHQNAVQNIQNHVNHFNFVKIVTGGFIANAVFMARSLDVRYGSYISDTLYNLSTYIMNSIRYLTTEGFYLLYGSVQTLFEAVKHVEWSEKWESVKSVMFQALSNLQYYTSKFIDYVRTTSSQIMETVNDITMSLINVVLEKGEEIRKFVSTEERSKRKIESFYVIEYPTYKTVTENPDSLKAQYNYLVKKVKSLFHTEELNPDSWYENTVVPTKPAEQLVKALEKQGISTGSVFSEIPTTNLPETTSALQITPTNEILQPALNPETYIQPTVQAPIDLPTTPIGTWAPPTLKSSQKDQLNSMITISEKERIPKNVYPLQQPNQDLSPVRQIALTERPPKYPLTRGDRIANVLLDGFCRAEGIHFPTRHVNVTQYITNVLSLASEGLLAQDTSHGVSLYMDLFQYTKNLDLTLRIILATYPLRYHTLRFDKDLNSFVFTRIVNARNQPIVVINSEKTFNNDFVPSINPLPDYALIDDSDRQTLLNNKPPSKPVVTIERSNGYASEQFTIPGYLFMTNGFSLWNGAGQEVPITEIQGSALVHTANVAIALINNATSTFPDQKNWVKIISVLTSFAYEIGITLEDTIKYLHVVNNNFIMHNRNYALQPENINDLVIFGYSKGRDPLNTQIFNVTFPIHPASKVYIQWQKHTNNPNIFGYIKHFEQNNIYGPQLLNLFRNYVYENFSHLTIVLDEYLKHMLKTSLDRNLIFLNSIRLLATVVSMDDPPFYVTEGIRAALTSPTIEPNVISKIDTNNMLDIDPKMQRAAEYQKKSQDNLFRILGAPLNSDMIKNLAVNNSIIYDYMNKFGGVGALFDLFIAQKALTHEGKILPYKPEKIDIVIALNTAISTSLIVDSNLSPKADFNDYITSPNFNVFQRVGKYLSQDNPFPVNFHIPEKPGTIQGDQMIRAVNISNSLNTNEPSKAANTVLKNLQARAENTLNLLKNNPVVAADVQTASLETSNVCKVSGLTFASSEWRQDIPEQDKDAKKIQKSQALSQEKNKLAKKSVPKTPQQIEKEAMETYKAQQRERAQKLNKGILDTYLKEKPILKALTQDESDLEFLQQHDKKFELLRNETNRGFLQPEKSVIVYLEESPKTQEEKDLEFLKQHDAYYAERRQRPILSVDTVFRLISFWISPTSYVSQQLIAPAVVSVLEKTEWYIKMTQYLETKSKSYPFSVSVINLAGKLSLQMIVNKWVISIDPTKPINPDMFQKNQFGALTTATQPIHQIQAIGDLVVAGSREYMRTLEDKNIYTALTDMFQIDSRIVEKYINESADNHRLAVVHFLDSLVSLGKISILDRYALLNLAETLYSVPNLSDMRLMLQETAKSLPNSPSIININLINTQHVTECFFALGYLVNYGQKTLEEIYKQDTNFQSLMMSMPQVLTPTQ
jgi:hypothetical protein